MTVQKELVAKREKEKAKRLELLREELEALEAWDTAFTPSPMPHTSLYGGQMEVLSDAWLDLASVHAFLSSAESPETMFASRFVIDRRGWNELATSTKRTADRLAESFPLILPQES